MRNGDDTTLPQQLDFFDITAIYIGVILGSGIFVAPAAVARAAPGVWAGVGLWLVGGVVAACGAFCYSECATRLPHSGGFYIFYREVYGPSTAFVGGWAAFLVTYPASLAAIALVLAHYLGRAIPSLAPYPASTACGALILTAVLSAVGLRSGPTSQRLLSGAKVLALLLVCAAALVGSGHAVAPAVAAPARQSTTTPVAAMVAAMMVLLWTYDGWSDVSLLAGEVRHPKRDLAVAVLVGTAILVAIYALVQVAVLRALPPAVAAHTKGVFAAAASARLGPVAGRIVAWLVVLSTFGALGATTLTAARVGFAMAADGLLPRWVARVHPRWQTPTIAVGVLTGASLIYAASGGFDALLAVFSFSVWIFYALVALAVLLLRRRHVGDAQAWRAPGGFAAPLVVWLTAAAMTWGVAVEMPWRTLVGAGLLLAAYPAYWLWRRLRPRGVAVSSAGVDASGG